VFVEFDENEEGKKNIYTGSLSLRDVKGPLGWSH
jgi:hypothetical protein